MADNDRDRRDDRNERGSDRARRDERPSGERRSFGSRNERPAYGARDGGRRDERPSYGNRDSRDGERRPFRSRDERPSYGKRDDRPSYGGRDSRGGDNRSYGSRDGGRRYERPSYGSRDGGRRDERPSYGNRDERPSYGGRDGGRRDERPSYGNRDDRPSYGGRDSRGGDRPFRSRDERPSYGNRDGGRRDDRSSYGSRDGGRPYGSRDERRGRDGQAGGHATRGGRRFEDDRGAEHRGGSRLVPTKAKLPEPRIDEDVTGFEIDRPVKNQLLTLSKENAQGVGQHLVMAARLLDAEELEGALAHAETAARRAGRVPAVREALGLVHYTMGDFAKALTEFRTARRLSGSNHLIPYLVDCERALGRPEKALELAHSPEAQNLPAVDKVELLIIESGIRRDLGQLEASKVVLEVGALDTGRSKPWYPRLAYAYAEALLALDDTNGAREWFGIADATDHDGVTDADERLAELDGYSFVDLLDGEDDEPEQAAPGAEATTDSTDATADVDEADVAGEPTPEASLDEAVEDER